MDAKGLCITNLTGFDIQPCKIWPQFEHLVVLL